MSKPSRIARCLLLVNVFLSACGGSSGTASTYIPGGSSDWPLFVYPRSGDPKVDRTKRVQWTAANNARAYELQIGTTLGGNDIFDSGIITSTSITMPSLPAGVVIYARVRAVLNGWTDGLAVGHWPRGSYTVFRIDDQTLASSFTNVTAKGSLAAGTPIEWNANPLAVGYQLVLTGDSFGITSANSLSNGNPFAPTSPFGTSISDSGLIHANHALIVAPTTTNVTAVLNTIFLTRTESTQLSFTLEGGQPSFADQFDFVKELTADVRSMADRDNQPYGGTVLQAISNGSGLSSASCVEFKLALMQLISEMKLGLAVRELDIALQENGYDTHTLVEAFDDTSNRWITVDPTFGLSTLRSDGVPATSAEISAAVRAQNWSGLKFEFLTAAGDLYARDYYIDYPLLFMDITSPDGSGPAQAPPQSLAAYFDPLPLPISGVTQSYALQCPPDSDSGTADLDDGSESFACEGADNLSWVFLASVIQGPSGSGVSEAWRLRRFAF